MRIGIPYLLLGLLMLASPAIAADAGPPAAAAGDAAWTGFYLGGQLGYGGYHVDHDQAHAAESLGNWNLVFDQDQGSLDGQGMIAGGQLGYDWQLGSSLLVGAVADYSWSGMRGSTCLLNCGNLFASPIEAEVQSFGTLRARAGYILDDTLLYVTGGGALAVTQGVFRDKVLGGAIDYSSNKTITGYALGGGIEHRFTPHVSAGLEYLHLFFADETDRYRHGFAGGKASYAITSQDDMNLARVTLNYRF